MTDLGTSIIRTVVPAIVGAILTAALKLGLDLDAGAVTSIVQVVVTAAYYAAARLLEQHVGPLWGRLLGAAKPPTY